MRKCLALFLLLGILLLPVSPSVSAGAKPDGYSSSDQFLADLFKGIPKTEDRVILALTMLKMRYPDWNEHFKADDFDCSEMSEYVSYFFRKCGLDPEYCQSDMWSHCWVRVRDSDGYIVVESTQLDTVSPGEMEFYNPPDLLVNRPDMRPDEIDWWNSEYLAPKQ